MNTLAGSVRCVLATVALAVGASGVAEAHTLDTCTARVSLRDGHVEVRAEWDVFALLDETPTALATGTPEHAAEVRAELRRRLERDATIALDDRPVALELTAMPSAAELQAIAASLSAGGEEHGTLVPLRFEARDPVGDIERLHVRFPPRLGPVLTTFVQPSTLFLPPGAIGRFGVLEPHPHDHAPVKHEHSRGWAFGAFIALGVSVGVHLLARRKATP